MSTIQNIGVQYFCPPLDEVLEDAKHGAHTHFELVTVTITDADGISGTGYTYTGGKGGRAIEAMIHHDLVPYLMGQETQDIDALYDGMQWHVHYVARGGIASFAISAVDIALWDWQGHALNCSVSTLLGGYRKAIPAYASTYHGDRNGGLDSKEAFGDFALKCRDMGYRAFKIHGWHEGNPKEEAALVTHVRRVVGDDITLMLDPACELRTFADALYVGRACDDANFFWLEDPYRDSGVSAFGHRKLREMLKTPILQTEHIRGVEPKADFAIAGGTDFLRSDPEYDMGITGCMKIHHMAESLGLDVEVHACGPAHRHLIGMSRNSNFYEVALVGPDCPNAVAPVYQCGYSDQLDCINPDGTITVPDGVGLGVDYDWAYILKNQVDHKSYQL